MFHIWAKNSGLSHITVKILANLDFESQLKCRKVCKSLKSLIDSEQYLRKYLIEELEKERGQLTSEVLIKDNLPLCPTLL